MLTLLMMLGLMSLGFSLLFSILGLFIRIAFYFSPFFFLYYLLRPRRRIRRYYW